MNAEVCVHLIAYVCLCACVGVCGGVHLDAVIVHVRVRLLLSWRSVNVLVYHRKCTTLNKNYRSYTLRVSSRERVSLGAKESI